MDFPTRIDWWLMTWSSPPGGDIAYIQGLLLGILGKSIGNNHIYRKHQAFICLSQQFSCGFQSVFFHQ